MRKLRGAPLILRKIALPAVLTASLMLGCRSQEPNVPDSGPRIASRAEHDERPQPRPAKTSPEPAKAEPAYQEAPELVITSKKRPAKLPEAYGGAMSALREAGLQHTADALDRRVKQRSPKMKLSRSQAIKIAGYLLQDQEGMPHTFLLSYEMPRASVELIRAVHERGVSKREAEKISQYLIRFIDSMDFQNLKQLDINHSHIIGREWEQIDYSGEPLDPQRQKRNGERMGVMNFKEARYIHRYFVHASKAKYFNKIYRPRGKMPDF